MHSLPIFFNIQQKTCVVIGGGDVATRKVTMLRKAGASVHCYALSYTDTLLSMAEAGLIHIQTEAYQAAQLDGAKLVIAATNDEAVNARISQDAQQANIPVNVVDAPALCTFTMPAIIDRSPIIIAVSSGGASPVLARLIRTKIETLIPASFGKLSALAAEFRDAVKAKFATSQERRIFWESIFQGPIAEQMYSGQDAQARQALADTLNTANTKHPHGEVYLVGGGPGDPDLLTFRALRLMQQCDVCVYDKLVSPPVLELVRRDAEMIYVGKARDQHTMPQDEINTLLARLAQEGKRVLRLKGGDPFIFGRGGEEIETLMQHGIPFQVVPGISAANGVSCYAGIPLTHRDYAQTCVFTTGHLKDGTVDLDWPTLAKPRQTVVIYMGLVGLEHICQQMIAHGLSPETPAAIVQQGTTPQQKVVTGTLTTLYANAIASQLKPPSLIIIGEVVKLHDTLQWFHPSTASDKVNR